MTCVCVPCCAWIVWVAQVDVFDAAYSRMIDAIKKSTDFAKVKLAHDEFLTTVTVHSYLRDRVGRPRLFWWVLPSMFERVG